MLNKQKEQNAKMLVAFISLFGLLTYTFVHTGALFARYVSPNEIGYIAAFGIEIAIAGMTWRLSRTRTRNNFLLFALVAALVVSALANVYEGYAERYGEQLTFDKLGQIDPVQAAVGLAATGLISLLVFAISEIIGGDVKKVVTQTEAKQKNEQQAEQNERPAKKPQTKSEQVNYQPLIFNVLANGDDLGPTAMAERVGCTKATAHKHIRAYREQGEPVAANGQG